MKIVKNMMTKNNSFLSFRVINMEKKNIFSYISLQSLKLYNVGILISIKLYLKLYDLTTVFVIFLINL